jgi:succinate-acetate transporter protein
MAGTMPEQYDPEANIGLEGEENNERKPVRVISSGEFVHIGETKVYKSELLAAFAGTLNPQIHTAPSRKFANPSPMGLCAFALTTFVLSLINVRARHVTVPNIVVGLAFFYGGLVQLIAGLWEVVVENTFGATALASFGAFWLSYGAIQTDSFGIISAYGDNTDELNSALGFFLIGWFIFTFILVLCTLRSTVAFFALFFFLDLTFLLLACASFTGHEGINKAGGWAGILTSFIAWYNAFAGIANSENFFFNVRPVPMPFAKKIV